MRQILLAKKLLKTNRLLGVFLSSLCFREDEQQHSEFHMESSTDSLFRTPTLNTRGRKRRSYDEGVAVSVESPTIVGLFSYYILSELILYAYLNKYHILMSLG